LVNAEQRQVPANLWTKPFNLGSKSASSVHIYLRYLLLLSPKVGGHFTGPTEGRRLSWPGWLVTYWDELPVRIQSPIQVLIGPGVE